MLVISDPYPLLRSPPIRHYHMVLAPEGGRVNLGFLYVRGAAMQPGGVPAVEAPGRFSAETICPYPPGVPVLAPGEVITAPVVKGLQTAARKGLRIAYASDPTLRTFRVLKKKRKE